MLTRTYLMLIVVAASSYISGCATSPTISDATRLIPVANDQLIPSGIRIGFELAGGGHEQGKQIVCLDSDGCLLFGNTIKSFGETTDLIAAKLTGEHELEWVRTYGGTHKDYLNAAIASADGGYLLAATSHSLFFTGMKALNPERSARPLIVHIKADGVPDWSLTMEAFAPGTRRREVWELYDVIQTKDRGYMLTGVFYGDIKAKTGYSMVAVKIDEVGKPIWAKRYEALSQNVAYALVETNDGVVIGGYAQKDGSDADAFVMKIDSQGNPVWTTSLILEESQTIKELVADDRGGITAVGLSESKSSARDIFMTKLDSAGKLQWANLYVSPHNDHPISLLSSAGSHLVLGHRSIDGRVMRGIGLLVDDDGQVKTSVVMSEAMSTQLWAADQINADVYSMIGAAENGGNALDNILYVEWDWRDGRKNAAGFVLQPMLVHESHLEVKATSEDAGVSYLSDLLEHKALTVDSRP